MKPFPIDPDLVWLFLDLDSQTAEALYGGEAVRAPQEIPDGRRPFCQGAEHDGPVGDGFVAGDRKLSPNAFYSCKFHGNSPFPLWVYRS